MSTPILEGHAGPAATLVAVDGRTYPLEKADLVARAEGGIATTTLVQAFANPWDEALELTYTLPLPADGAVLGYTIRVGSKVIRAGVQPREQADQAYRDALFQGRTAGLLEQARPDTFRQKLGNVPQRTKVEITIEVLHPLAFVFARQGSPAANFVMLDGAAPPPGFGLRPGPDTPHWEYRFPTVVGVRYHGAPGRVADQAHLSPDRGDIPARVSLALTISDDARGVAHSPSHAIIFTKGGDSALVAFRDGERLDRDVVVRWEACAGVVGARVVEGAGLAGDNGRYALVTLVPPAATATFLHRELTVLIDASGSMKGTPLALAKRVAGGLVNSLEPGDRFELLAFSNDVRQLTRGLLNATPGALESAHEALARLEADGSTEMASAIAAAVRPTRDGAQHQVVLVNDGDVSFESEVVAKVAGRENVRLHVVGVGSSPNRALTQQAAAAGRGMELLAGDDGSAISAAARLVAGTARPVLTGVRVQGSAVVGEKREWLRDVFAGQPLLVTVELRREGGTLEVRGDLAGSAQAWVQHIDVPAAGAAGALPASPLPLGALYGRSVAGELEIRRAGELELRRAGAYHGDTAALDLRIEALGMRHRIATSRTSMVAIEDTPSVDPRQPSRRVKLAVELPAGVSAEGVGLAGALGGSDQVFRCAADLEEFSAMESGVCYRRAERPSRTDSARSREIMRMDVSDVRWLGPNLLVVEFETPHDDFMLPEGELEIRVGGGRRVVKGTVVPAESSPRGPYDEGLVVRLAIRVGANPAWKAESGLTPMPVS